MVIKRSIRLTIMSNPPRKVFLFSGHMVDAPDRAVPRFPPSKVHVAKAAVYQLLSQLDAGPQDAAVCSAACGGDLIFDRLMLKRRVPLHLYLAFDQAEFKSRSVNFAGPGWLHRFDTACTQATSLQTLADLTGGSVSGQDPFERTNQWMLDAACAFGAERMVFICLWNGQGGDGPGGTQHMMQTVRQANGYVHWLDTRHLW